MSLFLGEVGRRIVNYSIATPRINRAVDIFGKSMHIISSGAYTPGLTRESFLLHQRTSVGDSIQVREDGFYRGETKIAGNEFISRRIINSDKPVNFVRTEADTPEKISKYCRTDHINSLYLGKLFKYTLGFSAIDALSRLYVNHFYPALDSRSTCSGILRYSAERINWQVASRDSIFDFILRSKDYNICGSPPPRAFN